ncbi:MAG: alpha/beta hydrolase [Pseudomonadota bacterium]|nr:alpha/beta hydrolase [Pseudomonadota bacterium]
MKPQIKNRLSWILLVAVSALWLGGCASEPSRGFSAHVDAPGLARGSIEGRHFLHAVFWKNPHPNAARLHVYLDGDGTPWVDGRHVATDPTPRNPLALDLMARDPWPAVYLGRPCYHGSFADTGCVPYLWTHGRYSPQVVDSMAEALRRVIRRAGASEVVLIGYSGGAALGRLLAPRIPEAVALVTVAGLHDTTAWARHHGYLELEGSLNPARQPPLAAEVRQTHFVGGRDTNLPTSLIPSELAGTVVVLPGFDHVCCWVENWAKLIGDLGI